MEQTIFYRSIIKEGFISEEERHLFIGELQKLFERYNIETVEGYIGPVHLGAQKYWGMADCTVKVR